MEEVRILSVLFDGGRFTMSIAETNEIAEVWDRVNMWTSTQ
jgi:hypothetical protein